jgi:serine/threonine protein kinase
MSTEFRTRDYGRFDELAEEFAERCRRGERPSLQEYIDRLPEMADEIRQTFPALIEVEAAEREARAEEGAPAEHPQQIGRYRVERLLGEGGFGLVYLAHDEQLQRPVAIKMPHRRLVECPEEAELYLAEARAVAMLDHPNIVPVYDVGCTESFPCFVVSKYINGTDLAKRLKQSRLSLYETVHLVATVAETLHHAHKQGLVHRDIKPGNILLV